MKLRDINLNWRGLILWSWAAVISTAFLHGPLGRIEGLLFPVWDGLTIHNLRPEPGGWTLFDGRVEKRRACNPVRVEWSVGAGDGGPTAPAAFDARGPAVAYPLGEISFYGWAARLTPDQLREGSYAVVYHRCHPGWLTITSIWPKKE